MSVHITIKGDLRAVDPIRLEGFLQALVANATGAPAAKVVRHGRQGSARQNFEKGMGSDKR